MNSNSILETVRKIIGPSCTYDAFDPELIIHINSIFMTLNQLGVGPAEGYSIENESDEWSDFTEDITMIEAVKSYVPLKVRLIFDPPTNGTVLGALEKAVDEFEWRILVRKEELEHE